MTGTIINTLSTLVWFAQIMYRNGKWHHTTMNTVLGLNKSLIRHNGQQNQYGI